MVGGPACDGDTVIAFGVEEPKPMGPDIVVVAVRIGDMAAVLDCAAYEAFGGGDGAPSKSLAPITHYEWVTFGVPPGDGFWLGKARVHCTQHWTDCGMEYDEDTFTTWTPITSPDEADLTEYEMVFAEQDGLRG